MKQTEIVIKHIEKDIIGKSVLEIACGCAELSIAASKVAKSVVYIDLDSFRLNQEIHQCSNVVFKKMDATCTEFTDEAFDCLIAYNAIAHLEDILEAILKECQRLVKPDGHIYFITSWKLDKAVLQSSLIPELKSLEINYNIEVDKAIIYLKIQQQSFYISEKIFLF